MTGNGSLWKKRNKNSTQSISDKTKGSWETHTHTLAHTQNLPKVKKGTKYIEFKASLTVRLK